MPITAISGLPASALSPTVSVCVRNPSCGCAMVIVSPVSSKLPGTGSPWITPLKTRKETSLLDTLASDDASAASIVEEAELLTALYQRLQELDPDGRRMCELIMQGKSEREAAEDMQMARSTFKRRWNTVKELLREQLKDYR